SSRRRHTRLQGDWSSDVCSSDLLSLLGLFGSPRLHASSLLFAASGLTIVDATGLFVAEQNSMTVNRADTFETGQAERGNFGGRLSAIRVEVHHELLVVLTATTFDGVGVALAS